MAFQKWNCTSYPKAETGNAFSTVATRLINGVDSAIAHHAGSSAPAGGTWGADTIGATHYRTTNEPGQGGDNLGGEWYVYETQGATPTYGWTASKSRGYYPQDPNVSLLSVTATTVNGWVDLDVGGSSSSDRALSVLLQVEVQDSNPGAGVYAGFRKNGVTTDAVPRRVYPQVSGITTQAQVWVELDSTQVLEYCLMGSGNTSSNLRIDLLGYTQRV